MSTRVDGGQGDWKAVSCIGIFEEQRIGRLGNTHLELSSNPVNPDSDNGPAGGFRNGPGRIGAPSPGRPTPREPIGYEPTGSNRKRLVPEA